MTAFTTNAVVVLDEAGHVLETLLDHMQEHATVIRGEDGARLVSPFGTVDVNRKGEALHLTVSAVSADILAMMKIFIAEHVFEFATGVPAITWDGDGAGDPLPAHFQTLTVIRAFDLTPHMRRVIFRCDKADAFAGNERYHIRLLLPPRGRVPRWPTVSASGRMEWPEGDDALVSRVYTIRAVDTADATATIDFVLHEGSHSPGAHFARDAQAGDIVGVLGPGGDGLPQGRNLLLLGDEAALPAIARMAENLPADCEANIFVEIADEGERQALSSAGRLRVNWLYRGTAGAGSSGLLERALLEEIGKAETGGKFIWAGCEQREAARLREILRTHLPGQKAIHRIFGYWNRQA